MNRIYLDNAGTTRVHDEVLDTMTAFFMSQLTLEETRKRIEQFKRECLKTLKGEGYAMVFTSSGSEANNLAIEAMAQIVLERHKPLGVLSTPIEHAAILEPLKSQRYDALHRVQIGVDDRGYPDSTELAELLNHNQIGMASMMYVNNEIGTILPIPSIQKAFKAHDVLFHTDAIQALGHIAIDLEALDVDFISFSAHKIHGPKGIGALAFKKAYFEVVSSLLCSESINLPYIAGFEKALSLRYHTMTEHNTYLSALKYRLVEGLQAIGAGIRVIGSLAESVPAILNLYVPFIEGDAMVLRLDMEGIAVSSGSACSSGAAHVSHVIEAIGVPPNEAKHCFRISISDFTTEAEIDRMISVIEAMLTPYLGKE